DPRHAPERTVVIRRVVVLGVLTLAAIALRPWIRPPADTLGPTLVVEDVVGDLLDGFEPGAVIAERADAPVALETLTPGDWLRGDGPRPSLAMPAPARVRLRATIPAGGALRFAAGVGGVTRREDDRSGIRFSVAIDGTERWTRTLEPSATRHDRRWFDDRVLVETDVDRTIDLELATAPSDPRHPTAGTPGWSHLYVTRRSSRPRQRADTGPNVLVLLVDTLRADRVGRDPTLTPALDRLASTGLRFDDAIAQASWTIQSVPSLMTGLLPGDHGVRGSVDAGGAQDDVVGDYLDDGLETWAEAA